MVVVAALAAAGCDSQPRGDQTDLEFEVVGDAANPPIGRTTLLEGASGTRVRPRVLPSSEVAVFDIARDRDEAASVWDQVGFDGAPPSLGEETALVVVAGGQGVRCPWDPTTVRVGHDEVSVYLDEAPPPRGLLEWLHARGSGLRERVIESESCRTGRWQPRALALTVPAGALPPVATDDPEKGLRGLNLYTDVSYQPELPLDPDSALWGQWTEGDPHELSREETEGTSESARLGAPAPRGPVTVTALPGVDVVHFQLDWRERPGDLSASYVDDPPVPVEGDAFLEVRLHHTAAPEDPTVVPDRIEAPAPGVITELVRVPDAEPLTWIVGVEGGTAPLSAWMDTVPSEWPGFTGWIRTIALRHDS